MTAKKSMSLNGEWLFTSVSRGEGTHKEMYLPAASTSDWHKGQVPGTVQGSLMQSGELPDPFWRFNAKKYRWIEEKEWWYRKTFTPPKAFSGRRIFLRFAGVDTIAEFFVNGVRVGGHENMLVPFELDVTDAVRPSRENVLAVRLDSVTAVARERDSRGIIAEGDRKYKLDGWLAGRYIRKANFAFGDDMSQRMLTVGIWRDVELLGYDHARIENCRVITDFEKGGQAVVRVFAEVEKFTNEPLPVVVRVTIRNGNGAVLARQVKRRLRNRTEKVEAEFRVKNPRLWWPNGMGEQNLYSLEVQLSRENTVLDEYQDHFGIRTIKLLQPPDRKEGGRQFTFQVNGVKVFAKGANWVPAGPLMEPVAPGRYEKLISAFAEAHMNMFRINGFGLYEDDEFYRLCDERGIMIWQDFAFSDCAYPDDDEHFLRECEKEGVAAVKRLRNHPCVALWCGNNEVDEMYYTGAIKADPLIWSVWGEKIFHEVLPKVCRELDPTRPYWPSSAWSSPGVWPLSPREGDVHWYSWGMAKMRPVGKGQFGKISPLPPEFGSISYRRYADHRGKFYSEYGQKALPEISTLKKVMAKKEIWPFDETAWNYHSTQRGRNDFLRLNLVISEFKDPKAITSAEEYVYYSQLAQAACLKFAIETFRTREFSCSGSLFWQANDCWPASTYSVIDYYLKPKIAYYWVKRAYDPLLVCFVEGKKNTVEVWIVNDTRQPFRGKLLTRYIDYTGPVRLEQQKTITAKPNTAQLVDCVRLNALKPADRMKGFLHAVFQADGRTLGENHWLPGLERDLAFPPCRLEARIEPGGRNNEYVVNVSTDHFARAVKVDLKGCDATWSDNHFNLIPGWEKTLTVMIQGQTPVPDVLQRRLTVRAVNSA